MEHQEDYILQKRLIDLSRMANRKGIVTFSNFLNLNEQNLFHQVKADLETSYQLSGGYEFAERQMIAFIPDALSYALTKEEWQYPIVCLRFYPKNQKFAEELSHRDILGALMHLGVDRSRIGDIKSNGTDYYIFCEEGIADYLLQFLDQIRHTSVKGEAAEPSVLPEQKFEWLEGIVTSQRLDSIVSLLTKKSRKQSVSYIQAQKVFVNACIVTANSYECKNNDVISVRGFGKYIYKGSSGQTRKGRMKVTLQKYI